MEIKILEKENTKEDKDSIIDNSEHSISFDDDNRSIIDAMKKSISNIFINCTIVNARITIF